MENILLVIHLLIALALVGVVLMQRSEGGALGMGGGGGGGGAGGPGMFSARGAANALTRTTAILAAAFMASSLGLAILAGTHTETDSIFNSSAPASLEQSLPAPAADDGPAVPLSQ
jgi:preprotein translocase subunit SecG